MSMPTMLGRYRVIEVIGRGGMGVVYRAEDPVIGRQVAVKVVRSDPATLYGEGDLQARFEREFRALGTLDHPHIVTIYDVGREGEDSFIAMEYVPGASLDEVLQGRAEIPADKALDLLEPIASALDYAHGKGIVHRDIKPGNILLTEEGRPKLTDFGIAKVTSLSVTRTGEAVGTPIYMAPEHVAGGEVGGAADQFALSVLLYRLLTGDLPFAGDTATTVMYKVVHQEPTPPSEVRPELPPALDPALGRGLAKQPEDRYGSCVEMVRAVRASFSSPSAGTVTEKQARTRRVPPPLSAGEKGLQKAEERPRPEASGRGKSWLAVVAALLVIGVAAVFALSRLRREGDLPEVRTAAEQVATRVQIAGATQGLTLRLNGRDRGVVPASVELLGLAGDSVRLELLREGELVAETEVAVGAEPVFDWQPFPAESLQIVSEPPGAEVELDGESLAGVTPLELSVTPFENHLLVLRLAGHRPAERSFELAGLAAEEREQMLLRFRLAEVAPPGTVVVQAPYPVAVSVGGRRRGSGRSVRVSLPPGEHALTVSSREVAFSRTVKMRLESGQERSLTDFPRAVTVHIAANPANCKVHIDGHFVDTTPTTQQLVVGDHEILLEWPALGRSTTFTERILRDGQRIFKTVSP